jgi:hypothetical protein
VVGKPEGKRPIRRRRCDDDIKMDLNDIRWDEVARVDEAQDRDKCLAVVNTVMNLRCSKNAGNFLTS